MGSKKIHIEFTQEQIRRYNGKGFKLCFSCGMGENTVFNVIVKADYITPNVIITWNDAFRISVSQAKFTNGVKFFTVTNADAIKFNQVYTLPPTWINGKITNESLPGNSFKLVNNTDRGDSAVVFKRINDKDRPFYISQTRIDSKAGEVLTPMATVALWFQREAEAGVMVSVKKKELFIFDFSS